MRTILTLLNLMVFIALCMIGFIKTGAGEEMIRKSTKGIVTEIVREEIKKQFPIIPKLSEKYNPKDFILNIDPETIRQ